MELIFDIVKSNTDLSNKNNHHFKMKGGFVGRSEECDFYLDDPSAHISNKHLEIKYENNKYFLKDISTNGTFLKHPYKKLPYDKYIEIENTNIFILGEQEIQARFFNNDYSQNDLISNNNDKTFNNLNRNIIPDDFSLSSELHNELNHVIDEINDIPSISNEVLNEHINMPTFKDQLDSIEEIDEVSETTEIEEVEITENPSNIIETSKLKQDTKEVEAPVEVVETMLKTVNNINSMEAISSLLVLEKKLGITISTLTQYERDVLLTEISDIVINSLEGLKKSLKVKDDIKIDLLKSNRYSSSKKETKELNPIKLGELSLNLIHANASDVDAMNISQAVKQSFNELDIHNVATHKTTKNLINISTNKFSPKTLQYTFEKTGKIIPYLSKNIQMWSAYKKLFSKLDEGPEFGIELIEKDYIKEYKTNASCVNLAKL